MTRAMVAVETLPVDEWDVVPPPGWEPVAELCRILFAERAGVTEQINEQIRREIAEFHEPSSVISRSDISWSTGGGVANFIRGVAACMPAREGSLEFQRLVGRRSAMRGLPLPPLIAAYEVGFRELWSLLAQRAAGGPAATLLLERGSIVWQRLVETTTAVAEGYKQEVARREVFSSTATAHFLEAIEQAHDSEEASSLARELGFDPEGSFRVVALGGPIAVSDIARSLVIALLERDSIASSTQRGRTAVVIMQPGERETLDRVLSKLPPKTAVAVGGGGAGLSGVRLSLVEAERALGLAVVRKNVCRFDDEWLLASLLDDRESLVRILAPGLSVAKTAPHLAGALRAFAAGGFSVAAAARMLTVSPNSLRYRLTRWRAITGWDPWTFDGLSRSLLAIDVADVLEHEKE